MINILDKQRQLQERINLSEEILDFQRNKQDIILELATGVGKAFNFLNICRNNPNERILFVIPQISLEQNFIDDVHKLGFSDLLPKITICCYASLKKFVGQTYDIIGYDEAQSLYSDARMRYVEEIKAKKRILLSATLDENMQSKLSTGFEMNVFSLPYEDAVDRGILPQVKVEIRTTILDDKDVKYPFKFGEKEVMMTAYNYYQQLNKQVKYWSERYNQEPSKPRWMMNKMLRAGADRIRWVGEYKTEFIKKTLSEVGNDRAVVFCASKEQAHLLGGNQTVSSDNAKKENAKIIKAFNDKENQLIFAKDMLIVGMNLSECKYAIVAALGSKTLKGTQQIGRLTRNDNAKMFILIVEDTVDEKFLQSSFGLDIYGNKI